MAPVSAKPLPHSLSHPKYRADIDGLRAVAVLSVVAFHAVPAMASGGFIGVDVFFVISGFLISTIIFENLERDSLSFAQFYRRRIRRIFPALAVVLGAVLVAGWFVLLPGEYSQLGRHVAAGSGFFSNFQLWRESGYFDNAADTKPLLHLWSLGIEEQFYIVWPTLLWIAWKARIPFLAVIVVIGGGSLALNIAQVDAQPVSTFYSPLTRSWELMAGALLAYLAVFHHALERITPRVRALLSALGAALLAAGLVLITSERAFPGWWALLPTLGAAALIAAGAQAWINARLLSHPTLVWFGLISYPLYLWHWPLLSFLRVIQGNPTHGPRLAAVILAIGLAWLTYSCIEKPIRFGPRRFDPVFVLAGLILLVGLAGHGIAELHGFAGYGPRTADRSEFAQYFEHDAPNGFFQTVRLSEKLRQDCDFSGRERPQGGGDGDIIARSCYERTPRAPKAVFIWGDSHAQQLYYGLRKNLPRSWDVLIVASSACPPDPWVTAAPDAAYCERSNSFAMRTIMQTHPEVVIVAQARDHDFEHLTKIGTELKKVGVEKVIFTGPSPGWLQDVPKLIVRRLWDDTPERTRVGLNEDIIAKDRRLKEHFSRQTAFIFVDLIDVFCNDAGCLTRIGADRKTGITSWDLGHLTPVASDFLARNALVEAVTGTGS